MTLQQVAQHAGVSASTVSRVINSMPGITVETADNVRAAMQALAYTPATRRRGRAKAGGAVPSVVGAKVAFVVLDMSGNQSVPAYDCLLRGVSLAAVHYQLDLSVLFVSDAQLAVDRLTGSAFEGLILHGTFPSLDQSRPLHRIPTVWLMGNRRRPVWGDQVMPDNATIGQMAAQHLLRNGHRRVMYFGLRSGWSLGVRMLAFQQSIDDAGGQVVTVAHRLADFDNIQGSDGDSAVAALVECYRSLDDKPSGLFLAEDWLVRPVYNAFRAAGIAIGPGTPLDVISCNNDRAHLVGVDPMPVTIDIRYEGMGYRAVEQLTHRLIHKSPADRVRIMLEPTLVPPPAQIVS